MQMPVSGTGVRARLEAALPGWCVSLLRVQRVQEDAMRRIQIIPVGMSLRQYMRQPVRGKPHLQLYNGDWFVTRDRVFDVDRDLQDKAQDWADRQNRAGAYSP